MAPKRKGGEARSRSTRVGAPPRPIPCPFDLPNQLSTFVDWSERGIMKSPIRNQGQEEICWAIAVADVTEAIYNLGVEDSMREALSAQELINCVKSEGQILFMKKVCKYMMKKDQGLSRERLSIHWKEAWMRSKDQSMKIETFEEEYEVNETKLLELLCKHPVVAMLDAYLEFVDSGLANRKDIYCGPIELTPHDHQDKHVVVVMGYDTAPDGRNYFKVRNSYGETWGDRGYGKVIRQSSSQRPLSIFNTYSYPVMKWKKEKKRR